MRSTRISPTSGWDLVEAFSNPVPANVAAALTDLGLPVIRTTPGNLGDEHLIRCPQHQERAGKPDRHPSCWVNEENGAFICFSCGYSGPFVTLAADARGWDRVEAARWILRSGTRHARDRQPARPAAEPELTEAALALFGPPPAAALTSRRITSDACAAYGVLWDSRTSRWILPIREYPSGRLRGWQEKGRHVFRNRPTGVKKSAALFGAHLLDGGTAVLVESPLDAVLLHSLGITGAVASYGALVSDVQMRIIKRRCDRLILALDNDQAGVSARAALYARWRPRGIPMLFLDYTGTAGKDPGEMTDAQILRAVDAAHLPFRKR
jgi:hypothetical protein